MTVGDVYEVRFEGVNSEVNRWNNTWHVRLTQEAQDQPFETSLALATMMATEWSVNMLPLMMDNWNLLSTRANRVWPSIGVPAVSIAGIGSGGIDASEALPADVAAVISKRTNEPGKRFRGRLYFGGIAESQQANGVILQAVVDDIVSAFDSLAELEGPDTEGNSWEAVVFSKTQADAALSPVAAPITRILVDRVLRNMGPRSTTIQQYVEGT